MKLLYKKLLNDSYHCDKEVRRFGRFLLVDNTHLDELDDNNIHYRAIRRLNTAGYGKKVYYHIAVSQTKILKAVELIDKVNETKRQPVTAYFGID